jgi:hypothetical protein
MIHFDSEEIAVRRPRGYADELSGAVAESEPIRLRKEVDQRRRAWINFDRLVRQDSLTRVVIGDEGDESDAFELAQPFVAREEKGFVLDDRAADRRAELIAAEFRLPAAGATILISSRRRTRRRPRGYTRRCRYW